MTNLHFDAPAGSTFEVDAEKRTIRGLALPYGVPAKSGGRTWQFAKGVLKYADAKRVKLLAGHDWSQAIGFAQSIEDTDDGLMVSFKVARGEAGDNALALAEDGVWDGLSVGLGDPALITYQDRDGISFATSAPLAEISLTPCPAFADARVTSVAASSDLTKGTTMTDTVTQATEESVDLSTTVTDAIAKGFETLRVDGPLLVQPTTPTFEVNEGPIYRFDGHRAKHDFSTDLHAMEDGDKEAEARVIDFMQEAFAPKFDIDTGNVATLNPTRNRPDMYVDQRKYATPLYDALYSGTLSDITPFVFPKFGSASNLVNPHVEGVEPTPGAMTATSQTVTPSAVSGKVEITREVWDQGGSPQVSSLIWNRMVYAYYQALEGIAVTRLSAQATAVTGGRITLTAGAQDAALVDELEGKLAELNFSAGGNFFSFAGTHIDLYTALAAASDTTGRKLLPIIGATNANGQATSGFKSLDVAGTVFTPAWSLGASSGNASSSFLVDPDSAHVWNSAPQRLDFQYRVAYVDLAIWGYVASAVSDDTGVREITYDPTA